MQVFPTSSIFAPVRRDSNEVLSCHTSHVVLRNRDRVDQIGNVLYATSLLCAWYSVFAVVIVGDLGYRTFRVGLMRPPGSSRMR